MLDDGSVNKAACNPEVHKIHNSVVNNQLQNKYSQRTKEFLKKYNIVV